MLISKQKLLKQPDIFSDERLFDACENDYLVQKGLLTFILKQEASWKIKRFRKEMNLMYKNFPNEKNYFTKL